MCHWISATVLVENSVRKSLGARTAGSTHIVNSLEDRQTESALEFIELCILKPAID